MVEQKPAADTVKIYGVECEVPEHLADDYELLEQIARIDSGDASVTPELFYTVLGGAYEAVKEAIRKRRGYVSSADMTHAVEKVLSSLPKRSS